MLIRLLGEVSAGEDAESLSPPRGRVATSVLAVLALARGRLVTTESLIDDLWEVPPDTARNAIQVAVSGLRKQFGQALVDGSRVGYRLRTDLVRIDWLEVEQYLATARDRMNTDDLVGAEADASSARTLFAGSELAGADSSSVRASRGLAAQLRRTASVMWAQSLVGLGRRDEAIAVLAAEANLSALDEPIHVLLMSVLREQGRSAEGLEIFELLRRRLDDQLGVLPSPDTVDEFHRLLDSGAFVDADVANLAVPRRPTVAIPNPATPLLGRGADVGELVELMRAGHALVTLLGPGGIGKTRLGIAAGRAFAELDQRPAVFLDLTLSRSDADTRRLLADQLDSEPEGIVATLTKSRMVVVLDNAEHLLAETAKLAVDLLAIQDLRLLVTSRSALELTQERRFEVNGLASGSVLSPAAQLLVDRAGFSSAETQSSAKEVQALAERCEGIPLVMELLGSALRWQSPSELLVALDAELVSISDRSRNRQDRHASVRAAIDWSVDHVGPDARQALGVLATVRGPFSAATADALIAGIGVPNPMDALARLVDASLVKRVREPGAIVFRMLEPIRLLAERFDQTSTASNLDAHADVYFSMLEEAHRAVSESTDQLDQLMVTESPNLALAAETRWVTSPDRAVSGIAQLLYGWYRRDRGSDVRDWADKILNSPHGSAVDRALIGLDRMMSMVGFNAWDSPYEETEFDRLNAQLEEVADQLEDEWHRRWMTCNHVRWVNANDLDQAEAWIGRMRLSSRMATHWSHAAKAIILRSRGLWDEAIVEGEAAVLVLDAESHPAQALQSRAELAFVRTMVGDYDAAEKDLGENLAYAESHGLGFERMTSQMNLAFLTALVGRTRECLTFVLSAMDWSGQNVFGSELALYAAIALHDIGDDTAAHALVSLVATSFLGEARGKPRLTDELYLRPHWERLLHELPELSPDPAGGWETSVARNIVADALACLPADT